MSHTATAPHIQSQLLLAGTRRTGNSAAEIAALCKSLQQMHPGNLVQQLAELYSVVAMPSATGRGNRKGREVAHRTLSRHFISIRK